MILNVRQAAKYLNVSSQTIYNYTKKGTLPHKRLGNRILFNREQLDEWVRGGDIECAQSKSQTFSPDLRLVKK